MLLFTRQRSKQLSLCAAPVSSGVFAQLGLAACVRASRNVRVPNARAGLEPAKAAGGLGAAPPGGG